jgi:hypothetical protein
LDAYGVFFFLSFKASGLKGVVSNPGQVGRQLRAASAGANMPCFERKKEGSGRKDSKEEKRNRDIRVDVL